LKAKTDEERIDRRRSLGRELYLHLQEEGEKGQGATPERRASISLLKHSLFLTAKGSKVNARITKNIARTGEGNKGTKSNIEKNLPQG